MYIIIFIIILAALIFFHELGHFVVAKLAGIRVDEFALGFPPRIISFQKGETRYSLNLIPFGGYVKIFGEDYEEAETVTASEDKNSLERSFIGKPKTIQVLVLIAGITFNILFAWVLLSIGFMSGMPVPGEYTGAGTVKNIEVTITSVVKSSPADKAGVMPGDKVETLAVKTQTINNPTTDQIRSFISDHGNESLSITVLRGENKESKTLTVTPAVQTGDNHATVGITMESLGTLQLPFFQALWQGGKLTVNLVKATAVGIAQFIGTAIIGQAHLSEVTGPVGIAGLVNDATKLGFVYLLTFTAFISINLALINLIPFPALDGGRVLFVIIEKIKGSPMNQKFVQIANMAGLAILLLLMFVVTYHDILNLFVK